MRKTDKIPVKSLLSPNIKHLYDFSEGNLKKFNIYIHIRWSLKLASVKMGTAHPIVVMESLRAYPHQRCIPEILHPPGTPVKDSIVCMFLFS